VGQVRLYAQETPSVQHEAGSCPNTNRHQSTDPGTKMDDS